MSSAISRPGKNNRGTARVLDLIAATIWALFAAGYFQRLTRGGSLWDLGLLAYYSMVVWLFVTRRPAQRSAPWHVTVAALASMAAPLVGLRPADVGLRAPGVIVQIIGLSAMFAATATLGRSFAIAPADRGLKTHGLYGVIRHPLYASELLFYAGYVLSNWSFRNVAVAVFVLITIIWRIYREEEIIVGYTEYARTVRWRLIPGVW